MIQPQINMQNHGISQEQANMMTEGNNGSILSHASQGLNGNFGNMNHCYTNYHKDVAEKKDVVESSQQSI